MDVMLAATYLEKNKILAKSHPLPVPGTNEALVKVFSTGICGSDLAIVSGSHPRAKPPLIIGHEFAGEIIELSKPGKSNLRIGNKVTLYPLISCGDCYACRNGLSHVCSSLRVIGFDRDGGLAGYASLPIDMLVKIPDSMSYEEGSLIEPLSVAVHSINMKSVSPDDKILVLGAGPIGLLTAMVLKFQGIDDLYISDINNFRLQIAESLGLRTINSLDTDIYKFIQDTTNGDMTDIVFEVAGVQESAEQMIDLVRPRGTIINVSVFKKHPNIDMRSINFKELTVIGSRVYTRNDFEKAIDISSHLPLTEIVSHRLPLSDVSDAFRLHKEEENVCKVLLNPHSIY
jgi:2-desacetyl-2-hydroxyethyl bacteriochlorophyllide A dehydrogenase